MNLAGIDDTKEKIKNAIDSGSAYEILCKMISAHGGDLNKIIIQPKYKKEIKAVKNGYLQFNQTQKMGYSILALSGNEDSIDKDHDSQSGFKLLKKHGSFVNKNDVVAEMFCMNSSYLDKGVNFFESSFDIVSEKPILYSLIY